jgi:hypothetical protein
LYDAAHSSRSRLASNCFQWPMFVPMVRERAARNDPLPGHRPLPRLCVHRLAAFEIRMSDGVFLERGRRCCTSFGITPPTDQSGRRDALAQACHGPHSCTYAKLSNRSPSPFFSSSVTLELTSRHPVRRRCNCPGLTVTETARNSAERMVTVASDVPPL